MLILVPTITFAQNYVQINNETGIYITVEPKNEIIIVPQNTTTLEELLEKLVEKEESDWNHGDVLISSATILAFLGFGTFFAMRFRSDRPEILFGLISVILLSAYFIEVLHLTIMLNVVLNIFNEEYYTFVIYITIGFLTLIIFSMIRINFILTRKKETSLVDKELDETIRIYLSRKASELQDKEEKIYSALDTLQVDIDEIRSGSKK